MTKTIAVIVPVLSLALAGWYVFSDSQESPTELPSVPQESSTEQLSVPKESPTELPSVPQESSTEQLSVPKESLTERLNRVCESCGVTSNETDRLIVNVRRVEITRKDAIGLFKLSFRDRGDAEVCAACAEAIMDIADEMSERQ